MLRKLCQTICAGVFVSIYSFSQTSLPHADRIFVNGKIWTEDEARPQAQALAVAGDKIIALGSDQEIKALAAPDTAIVMFSVDESDDSVRELMRAGAIAYRRKGVASHVLADSLNQSIEARAAVRQAQS